MMRVISISTLAVMTIISGCGVQPSAPPQSSQTNTVNDPSDANTSWRSSKPLTFEEAKAIGKCPIPLPAGATNIQYADFYAGAGGFSRYVRFEAPLAVCQEHAIKLLAEHNARQTQATQKVSLDPKAFDRLYGESLAASARSGEFASQAPWFDCDRIQDGAIWGDNRSHTPLVIIDKERSVFYYRISD